MDEVVITKKAHIEECGREGAWEGEQLVMLTYATCEACPIP